MKFSEREYQLTVVFLLCVITVGTVAAFLELVQIRDFLLKLFLILTAPATNA